jgi:hypothetical protein
MRFNPLHKSRRCRTSVKHPVGPAGERREQEDRPVSTRTLGRENKSHAMLLCICDASLNGSGAINYVLTDVRASYQYD